MPPIPQPSKQSRDLEHNMEGNTKSLQRHGHVSEDYQVSLLRFVSCFSHDRIHEPLANLQPSQVVMSQIALRISSLVSVN